MLIYGIILVIIVAIATLLAAYAGRSKESLIAYHEKQIENIEKYGKGFHYASQIAALLLNISTLGYLIYALICL